MLRFFKLSVIVDVDLSVKARMKKFADTSVFL